MAVRACVGPAGLWMPGIVPPAAGHRVILLHSAGHGSGSFCCSLQLFWWAGLGSSAAGHWVDDDPHRTTACPNEGISLTCAATLTFSLARLQAGLYSGLPLLASSQLVVTCSGLLGFLVASIWFISSCRYGVWWGLECYAQYFDSDAVKCQQIYSWPQGANVCRHGAVSAMCSVHHTLTAKEAKPLAGPSVVGCRGLPSKPPSGILSSSETR